MAMLLLSLLSKPWGIRTQRQLKQNYNVVHVELKQRADDELDPGIKKKQPLNYIFGFVWKKRLQAVMQAPTFPNKRAHATPTLYILVLPEC